MTSSLFVHTPAHLLLSRLPYLLNRDLQPEVACQEVRIDQLDFEQLAESAQSLAANGLGTTLHAPFSGFNPGSRRKRIRNQSREIALQTLQLAKTIGAQKIVFHPGLELGSIPQQLDFWLEQNILFWPEFIHQAESFNCCLCLENIYEVTPDILLQLFQEFASPSFGHCFDIGHWNVFSDTVLIDWLERMAPWLQHLHLHDNGGQQDEHLPIGQGSIDFAVLFAWLKAKGLQPTMTLEAHSLPHLDQSLSAIKQFLAC
jgi:sugar phosphate isomerase/epimerase